MARYGLQYPLCSGCRRSMLLELSYTCPRCGAFSAHMYRREHADPYYAKNLTLYGIVEEYRQAGQVVPEALLAAL